jgi:hypothetical protein
VNEGLGSVGKDAHATLCFLPKAHDFFDGPLKYRPGSSDNLVKPGNGNGVFFVKIDAG